MHKLGNRALYRLDERVERVKSFTPKTLDEIAAMLCKDKPLCRESIRNVEREAMLKITTYLWCMGIGPVPDRKKHAPKMSEARFRSVVLKVIRKYAEDQSLAAIANAAQQLEAA